MQSQIEYISTNKLIPYARNSRTHSAEQIMQIAGSIKEFGFTNPVLIDENDTIIAGHGRVVAAQRINLDDVPCIRLTHLTEAQKKAYVIADNKIALNAGWDDQALINELKELEQFDFDLGVIGFYEDELNKLLVDDKEAIDSSESEYVVPKLIGDPVTRVGDVYILGAHRLKCGDSTVADDVMSLMNGTKADIVFTSPPYNVGKTPNGVANKYASYIDNKSSDSYVDLLFSSTSNGLFVADYVFFNVQSLAGNKVALIDYLYLMKDYYADTIIWDKENAEPAMARRVLNSRYEYIHIFSKDANRAIGKKDFRGTISNIFSMNSRSGKEYSDVHRATFRVEVPEYFINNFAESSVVDLFGGVGATLIAAEKQRVRSYLMEIDPGYCDVIIKRWQNFTGEKAFLESSGELFDDLINKDARK